MKPRRGRGGYRGGKRLIKDSSIPAVKQPSRCWESVDNPKEPALMEENIKKSSMLERNKSSLSVQEINAKGARVKKVASWLSNISVEEMATPGESMDTKMLIPEPNCGSNSDSTCCSCCFTRDIDVLKFKLGDNCYGTTSAKEAILKILPNINFPLKDSDVICSICFQTLMRTLRFIKMFIKVNYRRLTLSHDQNQAIDAVTVVSANNQNTIEKEGYAADESKSALEEPIVVTNGKERDDSFQIQCIDEEALIEEERYFDEISHYCATKTQYRVADHPVFGESEKEPFDKLVIIPKAQEDQLNHFLFDIHKDIAVYQHSSAFEQGDKRLLLLGNIHYKVCSICEKRFTLQDEFRKHFANEKCKFSEQSSIQYFLKSPSLTSLKCDVCGASFSRLSTKRAHMMKCVMFDCFYCNEKLNGNQLLEHSRSLHNDQRPFKCRKCTSEYRLYKRYKEHNCEAVLCHKCGKVPASIQTHSCNLSLRSKPSTIRCHHCNEHIPTSEMKEHIKLKHRIYYCDCKRRFFTVERLEAHKKTSCLHVKHQCNICKKLFARSHIKKHMQIHQQRVRSFECETCKKKFFTELRLREHVKKTHFYNEAICEYCGIKLREYSMRGHMLLKHNRSVHQMKCPIPNCEKVFVRRDYLRRHVEKHRRIQRHLPLRRVFPADQTVTCKFCLKRFRGVKNLKMHLVHHMPLSRFRCRYCTTTCSTSASRRRHEKAFHNENREEFKCNTCWKIEPSKEKLAAHVKSVHKKRKYKCWYCREAFSRHFQLSTHIIEHAKPIEIERERKYVMHNALADYMEVSLNPPTPQNHIEYEVESNKSEEFMDNELECNDDEDIIDESMYRLIKVDEQDTAPNTNEELYLEVSNDGAVESD